MGKNSLVGEAVVNSPNDINKMQESAGENASLNSKENFEPCPHLDGIRPDSGFDSRHTHDHA